MPKFTEGFADKLMVPPGARDVQAFDDELPGFGIRKFAKGHASYFVKFNVGPQQRRKTLGKVVRGNLKAMRLEASVILAKARLGVDTVAVARAAAVKTTVTLGTLVPLYLAARAAGDDGFRKLRDKSLLEVTRYLAGTKQTPAAWKPLHGFPIDGIGHGDVQSVVDDLARSRGKVVADSARAALSSFFAWTIAKRYANTNPAMNIRAWARGGARERVLTEAELVRIWKACLDDDYGRIVRLLILCGQRRAEIGDLAWSEIDLNKRQIELPGLRTKNNHPHIIPLCEEALAILETVPRSEGRDLLFGSGARGFSAWSDAKADLDLRITAVGHGKQLPAWVLHDLRRSFVTHVSERGLAQPHVVEAIVNHVSGHKGGVAGVYNRAAYATEKRQSLELWGAHVSALVEGHTSKVVPLRRTK